MKIGTENRSKVIGAIVLAGLAIILAGRAFLSSSSPEAATIVPPVSSTDSAARPAARRTPGAKAAHVSAPRLDPTLQLNLLKQSESIKYEGSGRNIFIAHEDVVIPKPTKPVVPDQPQATGPPPPPPPPPITLKFFGFANKPGEPKKVFLSQGEDVFIAGEGDIVDRRYRVLRIINNPASVEVEDVLNNNRQTIPLTQG